MTARQPDEQTSGRTGEQAGVGAGAGLSRGQGLGLAAGPERGPERGPWRNRVIGLGLAGLVFAVDQAIKALMRGPLQLREVRMIELLPVFNLTWTENAGVSLGMFSASSDTQRWLLVGVTAAIAVAVLVWMARERLLADIVALALVLGGALGNILDRVVFGYVIDYADLHIGSFRPFLIFNVADAAITIGVVIILARSLFMRQKPHEQQLHEQQLYEQQGSEPDPEQPASPKRPADHAAEIS